MLTTADINKLKEVLPTKEDLKWFATRDDLKVLATKADLKAFATKNDLKSFATKHDLMGFTTELLQHIFDVRKELKGDIYNLGKQLREELASKQDLRSFRDEMISEFAKLREYFMVTTNFFIQNHEKRITKLETKTKRAS